MKILVATDGSKAALSAVDYAAKLSVDLVTDDSITLINVHEDVALRHASQFVGRTQVEKYLHDLSEKELEPARALLDTAGIQHNQSIQIGHVAEEIVKFANSGDYDLIVMGSTGRSGIADLLMGSVAQRVLTLAKQPVLLVK